MVTARERGGRPGETPDPYGSPMRRLTLLIRGLGAAGAVANARAELETAHVTNLQAVILARRVNSSGRAGEPLSPVAEVRVA
jgi:hypothetical protein